MAKTLKPQWLLFISNYLATGNGRKSAIAAGFSEKNASKRAQILLKNPLVIAEIDKHAKELEKQAGYSKKKAHEQTQRAYDIAEKMRNAMAMVKATELMSKLEGFLIERHQVQHANYSVILDIDRNYEPKDVGPINENSAPLITKSENEDDDSNEGE